MPSTPQPSVSVDTSNVNVSAQDVRNNIVDAASANRISKFLAKPAVFRGEKKDTANPMVWLHAMERIYNGMNFSDDEMVIVLASYFAGPAAIWWNVIEPRVKSWADFVNEFTIQYASGSQQDAWWEELESMCQSQGQSVDDIKFRIMELSTLLNVSDPTKIRYFMRAIHKSIALRVADVNPLLTNWEEVTASAKRIETNNNKYGKGDTAEKEKVNEDVNYFSAEHVRRNSGDAASVVSINSLASTVDRLCQGFDALQLSLNTASNSGGSVHSTNHVRIANPPVSNGERRCYNCQETGHIATYCSKPRVQRRVQDNYGGSNNIQSQSRTPATGVNALPLGDSSASNSMGKEQGRH